MYQIKLSIKSKDGHWLLKRYGVLEERVKRIGGIVACVERYGRVSVAVACENQHAQDIKRQIKKILVDIYITDAKESYFRSIIRFKTADALDELMLFHALTAFDRDRDREYIAATLTLSDDFSIDGYYMFKLGELKKRWGEIAGLTDENIGLLYDEEALFLLLRFLLSAADPKCETVTVGQENQAYYLRFGEENHTLSAAGRADLMLGLIDIAPAEVLIEHPIDDADLNCLLYSLFDVNEISAFSTENYQ